MSVLKSCAGFELDCLRAVPNSMVAWAALAGLAVSLVLFAQDRRRGISSTRWSWTLPRCSASRR
jgi:hypothetical protein